MSVNDFQHDYRHGKPLYGPADFLKEEFSFIREALKHGRKGMMNDQAVEILLNS